MNEVVSLVSSCDRGLAPLKFILNNTKPGRPKPGQLISGMLCSTEFEMNDDPESDV